MQDDELVEQLEEALALVEEAHATPRSEKIEKSKERLRELVTELKANPAPIQPQRLWATGVDQPLAEDLAAGKETPKKQTPVEKPAEKLSPTTRPPLATGESTPQPKPKRKSRFGLMLRGLIGIHEPLVDDLPGDRAWFTRASWVLVLVAVIASISMANALTFTLGPDAWPFAVAFGIVWGVFILGIDTLILFPKLETGRNNAVKIGLRLVVAVLLGALISAPLMATIFKRDVDRAQQEQVSVQRKADHDNARSAARKQFLLESSRSSEDSQARFDQLTAEQQAAQVEANNALAACTAAQSGRTALRTQICADADTKTARASALQAALDAERGTLTALQTQAAAQVAEKLDTWEKDNPLQKFKAEELGVWDRIKATHHLLGWVAWLIVVALILIDAMAVILKILRGNGRYEQRMDALENPPKRGRKPKKR